MVTVLLSLSVIIGVLAYWRYTVSERHLHQAFDALAAQGASIDTEACVPTVLAWHRRCEAMKSLCDHSIPLAMTHCLAQRDAPAERAAERKSYCKGFVNPSAMGRWTHKKCGEIKVSKKDGAKRGEIKACGYAFRAIAEFCRRDGEGVSIGLPSKRGW